MIANLGLFATVILLSGRKVLGKKKSEAFSTNLKHTEPIGDYQAFLNVIHLFVGLLT